MVEVMASLFYWYWVPAAALVFFPSAEIWCQAGTPAQWHVAQPLCNGWLTVAVRVTDGFAGASD